MNAYLILYEVINLSIQPISCNQTLAVATHRIFPPDLNEHQTVFGGKLLSLVDDSASVAAVRLTHAKVVTASLDHINFLVPFQLDNIISMEAYVSGTGHRSLEVFAKLIGEDLMTGKRFLGFTCFLTYVLSTPQAASLPTVRPVTKEQRYVCAGYLQRYQERQAQRASEQALINHVNLDSPFQP
ncbi:acyl-CoA thioesterase [Levilactobacillus suantsaii]|nr:acyl-CoA thioesterase [Levilactobacillus suantsaii]